MPRKSRIDAPGALHHIIVRGIERSEIFKDNIDRNDFLDRLGKIIQETKTKCYAWSLIPNHFHLLLKTGQVPIATVMLRLLTGYAVFHNKKDNGSTVDPWRFPLRVKRIFPCSFLLNKRTIYSLLNLKICCFHNQLNSF